MLKDLITVCQKAPESNESAVLHDRIELGLLYCEMESWGIAEAIIGGVVIDWLQTTQDNDALYERLKEAKSVLLTDGKISAWNRFTFGELLG